MNNYWKEGQIAIVKGDFRWVYGRTGYCFFHRSRSLTFYLFKKTNHA